MIITEIQTHKTKFNLLFLSKIKSQFLIISSDSVVSLRNLTMRKWEKGKSKFVALLFAFLSIQTGNFLGIQTENFHAEACLPSSFAITLTICGNCVFAIQLWRSCLERELSGVYQCRVKEWTRVVVSFPRVCKLLRA